MRGLALAVTLLFSPALLLASENADLYVIPVAGHLTGTGGSNWASDIAIQNFQSTPLTVQLIVIESGEGMPDNVSALDSQVGSSVTVPANGTRILRDALNGHRGLPQTIGAVIVGADRPFAVSSRAYSIAPNGATESESVMPVADFLDNSLGDTNLATASAYVPGLTANTRYRANLGFVAGTASSSGLTLEVTLRGANGALLGTRMFTIPGSSFEHVQFSSTSMTTQSFDEASATYRIVSGDGAVIPYASVIDNLSAAGFYISGQFPANPPFGKSSAFRSLFKRMTQ
ncbi:MAG TPA: hypothetical protein VII12_20190 [Thermoanaerobaculia bacterium]